MDTMKVKLGFVLLAIMLLSAAGASSAEQLVRAGYSPFGAPLTSLPGATLDNYRTLDPSGTATDIDPVYRPYDVSIELIINPADGKPIDEELLALAFADEIKQAQAKYDLLCS
jgi:hypothetical protein